MFEIIERKQKEDGKNHVMRIFITRNQRLDNLFQCSETLVDQDLLIVEVPRSHSDTAHSAGLL
jgi:hypothetical protein